MIDNRMVGNTIAKLRQARNMTQQQLASALNVSHQAVSKWENGAALPDIETMMALTHFFGITVEQLISGDVPESRLTEEKPQGFDFIHFVNGVVNDIGSLFRSEPAEEAPEGDDGSIDAEVAKAAEQEVEEAIREAEQAEAGEGETPQAEAAKDEGVDLKQLLEMAPFMSRGAVAEMLEKAGRKLTAEEIARFAPYLEGEALEKLIRANCTEMSWETLRKMAPFLRKEVVDAFARVSAHTQRVIRGEDEGFNQAVETVQKGVDEAVRKVVRFGDTVAGKVSRAFEEMNRDTMSTEERLAALRRQTFEKAMDAQRWDWIEAHLSEVTDHELRREIAERAMQKGMETWVLQNLGDFVPAETVDRIIESGDWGWLHEHAWSLDKEQQKKIALSAAKAENWQWLANCAEQLDLTDCVEEIAISALDAGARMLAVQLAHYDMTAEQAEALALHAVDAGDEEFVEMIADVLTQEGLCRCALRLLRQDDWPAVEKLTGHLNVQSLTWLMQEAIEKGNFEAIDRLDACIKLKMAE